MDKILVSVYVLTIGEEYNISIPINKSVKEVIHLMQKTIKDLSGGYYIENPNAILFDGIDGTVINFNNIVKFSGLKNGARLLLI